MTRYRCHECGTFFERQGGILKTICSPCLREVQYVEDLFKRASEKVARQEARRLAAEAQKRAREDVVSMLDYVHELGGVNGEGIDPVQSCHLMPGCVDLKDLADAGIENPREALAAVLDVDLDPVLRWGMGPVTSDDGYKEYLRKKKIREVRRQITRKDNKRTREIEPKRVDGS